MPVQNLLIKIADVTDALLLTSLGITTFIAAFAKDNRKEDMDKYIAEEMNIGKITEELKDQNSLFFLAYFNDDLSGYAKIRWSKIPDELANNIPIELERIYVLEKHQGKKIGAALLNLCLTHAVTHGYDTLWLGVWGQNHKAINFYLHRGFEFFGSHQFILGNDIQTDRLMKKVLQQMV